MPSNRQRLSPAFVLLIWFMPLALGGCEQDPTVTVRLEISNISDEDDREDVQDRLKEMTDGSSHMMSSTYFGKTFNIDLSPVADVESFAKKIDFGTVTLVDAASRTIKVDFVK